MQDVKTYLRDAQQHVLQFVGPDTFLVGHALDNDLKVLKLVHTKNLDTGILYPHARVCYILRVVNLVIFCLFLQACFVACVRRLITSLTPALGLLLIQNVTKQNFL